jgi:hypothetical protein
MTEPTTDPGAGATKTPKQVLEQALCLSMGMCNTALPHALIHRLEQEGYVIEKANVDDDRAARTLADIFGDEWGGISGEPDIAWEDAEEEDREMWRSVARRFSDYLAARPDGAR